MIADCVFCKIVSGKIPSAKIFENDSVLAFLDIAPAAKGHALVVPKKHFATLLDVPEKELQNIIVAVQKVAKKIVAAAEAEGFNVIQSNHNAAGQVVPHLHFHIIPRKANDNLSFEWQHIELDKEELEGLAKIIKEKEK